jgi:ketosteroid isomerase-like protein
MAESAEIGPMESVRQFVEGFNTNDVDVAQAACADENSIIDDFPPYEWTGPGATTRWFGDMARMGSEYGMSDPSVTLDEPRHVMVSGPRAYVVVPIDVRWLQDGAPAQRAGSMTLALREGANGWRISACAWTWD